MEVTTPEIDIDVESSPEVDEAVKALMNRKIILYNDDVNTFEHVIACLMEYCKHSMHQAEQCALIVHHNGKCAIKEGSFEDLKPVCEALLHHGLSAKIE